MHIRKLDISPPNCAPETASLLFETNCISLHVCSFVNQQFQSIPSFQNLINILYHDITHLSIIKQLRCSAIITLHQKLINHQKSKRNAKPKKIKLGWQLSLYIHAKFLCIITGNMGSIKASDPPMTETLCYQRQKLGEEQ